MSDQPGRTSVPDHSTARKRDLLQAAPSLQELLQSAPKAATDNATLPEYNESDIAVTLAWYHWRDDFD